ncbi:MAG: hypothetical protein Fur0024_5490 [Patescibacteria group bacterium]
MNNGAEQSDSKYKPKNISEYLLYQYLKHPRLYQSIGLLFLIIYITKPEIQLGKITFYTSSNLLVLQPFDSQPPISELLKIIFFGKIPPNEAICFGPRVLINKICVLGIYSEEFFRDLGFRIHTFEDFAISFLNWVNNFLRDLGLSFEFSLNEEISGFLRRIFFEFSQISQIYYYNTKSNRIY